MEDLGKVSASDIIKLSSNIGAAKVSKKLSKTTDNVPFIWIWTIVVYKSSGSKNGSLTFPIRYESNHLVLVMVMGYRFINALSKCIHDTS